MQHKQVRKSRNRSTKKIRQPLHLKKIRQPLNKKKHATSPQVVTVVTVVTALTVVTVVTKKLFFSPTFFSSIFLTTFVSQNKFLSKKVDWNGYHRRNTFFFHQKTLIHKKKIIKKNCFHQKTFFTQPLHQKKSCNLFTKHSQNYKLLLWEHHIDCQKCQIALSKSTEKVKKFSSYQ